jgi:hypothetical protein
VNLLQGQAEEHFGRHPDAEGLRRVPGEGAFVELDRDTYKVLLTRGTKGPTLYAVDPATQEFLAGLIEPVG